MLVFPDVRTVEDNRMKFFPFSPLTHSFGVSLQRATK
jgi:hypothetical protein